MADRPGPVLVTGANSGIGLAATLRLAERGWETWGTVRSAGKAKVVEEAAAEAGVADRVHPLLLDVSDHDAVVERWPELPAFYAVVNNAGYSELDAIEQLAPAPHLVARTITSAIESSRPLRRYLVGADAITVASTHPFIPRSLTDAATRLLTGLGGGPSTYT